MHATGRRLQRLLPNAALLVLSCAAALLLGELMVRRFAPEERPHSVALRHLYRPDPQLGYVMAPGFRRDVRTHVFSAHMETNRMGLRDHEIAPRDGSTLRLVGIGDSFALGIHAGRLERCYLKRLQQLVSAQLAAGEHVRADGTAWTRAEFVNAGTDGYGTLQEVGLLERLGPSLQPDAVLLAFYLGNDFTDNSGRTRMAVEDGYLMLEASAAPHRAYARPLHRRVRLYLNAHSELYVFMKRRVVLPLRELRQSEPGTSSTHRHLHEYVFDEGFAASLSNEPSPIMDAGMANTRAAFARLRAWCDAHGARVLVCAIPEVVQVDPQARQEWLHRFGLEHDALDFTLPNQRLRDLTEEAGLPLVDLTADLRAAIERGESIHFANDHHWNARGHEIAAQLLLDPVMHELVDGPPLIGSRGN
jgi:hypothetical protein